MTLPANQGRILILLVACCWMLCGCGKKGAIIPPEAVAPAPIHDLDVAQQDGYFKVSWSAPSKQEGGARLEDLAGFVLLRRPVLPPDMDCEQCGNAYQQLKRIDLDFLQGVQREGGRFVVRDSDLKPGETYQYKVLSFNREGAQSTDSNKVRHMALPSPQPPVVEALSSGAGVVLVFVAPPPKVGTISGYNIYRRKSGAEPSLTPINPKPVTGNTYVDQRVLQGTNYDYTVTTVASLKGESVESTPSNQVQGHMVEPE